MTESRDLTLVIRPGAHRWCQPDTGGSVQGTTTTAALAGGASVAVIGDRDRLIVQIQVNEI